MNRRLHFSLVLISISLIAFQLSLMQILSVVQWYHFASMTISVALLGFGAAGTVLALFRTQLLDRAGTVLPVLMCLCALFMLLSVALAQYLFGGFDVYLLFVDPTQFWQLLLTQLILFLPMFSGALAIGLVFILRVEAIGSLYFANLLGSGLGGLIAVGSMWLFTPARLPAVCSLFALVAGLLLISKHHRRLHLLVLTTLVVIFAAALWPVPLQVSQYKGISHALDLPGAAVLAEKPSPYGLLQLVSAPAMRDAPELSLTFTGEVPTQSLIFNNGDSFGPLLEANGQDVARLRDYTTKALPYELALRKRVLVLQAATGVDAMHALQHDASRIVAVEAHRALPALLAEQGGAALIDASNVAIVGMEPRTYLAQDKTAYDLIVLPDVGSFGGNAGLSALSQQYLLTTEAFSAMWRHLSSDGVITVTSFMDYPVRNPLRLAATLVAMLRDAGVAKPADHLAAVRNWGSITFVVKRQPLTADDAQAIRGFCRRLQFDPALLPGIAQGERARYHALGEPDFLDNLDKIVSGESDALVANYPFRLQPADDNRPYFSQFLRWDSLPYLARLLGQRSLPFVELGYLVQVIAFVQLALAAVLLILLPLLRLGWSGGRKLQTFGYFGALGLGYMFFEIALLHQLVFYLGQPILAAAGAIGAMLVFSGAGSYLSGRMPPSFAAPQWFTLSVALVILLYSFMLPEVLSNTVSFTTSIKVLLVILLIAPPALLMGFPFPTGLRRLAQRQEPQVPWAWGINGCLSVVATPLAAIIAVEAGFTWVMLLASAAYAIAAVAASQHKKSLRQN